MLDILLALKWVKTHIKYFGGNPNKITVIGQSSGGAMASSLLVSPSVPPNLFHQMIIHSGTIFAPWAWSLDPIANARDIARRSANVTKNATIHEINEALMNMDVFDLMQATDEHYVIELFSNSPYTKSQSRLQLSFSIRRMLVWFVERIRLVVVHLPLVDHRIICHTNRMNCFKWAFTKDMFDFWPALSKMKAPF